MNDLSTIRDNVKHNGAVYFNGETGREEAMEDIETLLMRVDALEKQIAAIGFVIAETKNGPVIYNGRDEPLGTSDTKL